VDREIIEKYKAEMLRMYAKTNKENVLEQKAAQVVSENIQPQQKITPQTNGNLLAVVTTVRTLYPVPNAKVTVFTGNYQNMKVVDYAFTDQSGRTKVFVLPAPSSALSLDEDNKQIPYVIYNMLIEADGYIDNIHLNIPVFSGVTSIQGSNMLLKETAGANMDVQIFDEAEKYDL
jgi:hypothetical protein